MVLTRFICSQHPAVSGGPVAGWGPAWVLRAKAVIPSAQGSRLAPARLCSALQISVLLGSVSLSGIWKPVLCESPPAGLQNYLGPTP